MSSSGGGIAMELSGGGSEVRKDGGKTVLLKKMRMRIATMAKATMRLLDRKRVLQSLLCIGSLAGMPLSVWERHGQGFEPGPR